MASKPTILLIEDTSSLAHLYCEYLKRENAEVLHAATGRKALERIKESPPAIILLDLQLPDMDGIEILRHVYEERLPSTVIIITAHGSMNLAVEAMRYGCYDFIVKPFTSERLTVTIRNALERHQLTTMVADFKEELGRDRFCGFIGSSLPMQSVYRTIESAAHSKATIFITGESGTGKEVCAESIHRLSQHNHATNRPFIPINCGAIPKDLIESVIFGHVKGAFTGAISDHEGAASQANGGTLFLDEICEMDLNLQTKLLRFIQTGSFTKVGGNKLESVDVRFICATNRDPWAEVKAGRFREDLYYRLMVIPIELPPLRVRDDDVLLIAGHFLRQFAGEEGKQFTEFSPEVEQILSNYKWPGNIRQLQNVIRNIVVLHNGEMVTPLMLPPPLNELTGELPVSNPGVIPLISSHPKSTKTPALQPL
jgi:DNA-binding NtrC family response regulator